nr:hypothetical protein Itr_chr15CG10350 [Ipomoea trifida]
MSRDGPPSPSRGRATTRGARWSAATATGSTRNSPLTLRNGDSKTRRWSPLPLCDEQKTAMTWTTSPACVLQYGRTPLFLGKPSRTS